MIEVNKIVGTEKLNIPSIVNNPFDTNSITSVCLQSRKSLFSDKWIHTGTVDFENGRTKGEQRFEGKDIDDVLTQIREFVQELVDKK